MQKSLLLKMIELANANQGNSFLYDLALKIAVDPELDDMLIIEDFSNEFYSVREIRYIEQCFNFKLK